VFVSDDEKDETLLWYVMKNCQLSHTLYTKVIDVSKTWLSHAASADLTTAMESISRLRAVLVSSLGPHGSQRGEQGLFDELMVHKERLLHLFDVGPRNAQEQHEIQSGNR
jgi:hypothetical protein